MARSLTDCREHVDRRLVQAGTTAAALDLAARTDLVTVVAGRVSRPAWTRLGLHARPLPFDVPPVPVILSWHHRNDSDPAHAWLRAQVRTALRGILDGQQT